MSTFHRQPSESARQIQAQAANWLCRREEGLNPDESEQYSRWLAADPRHPAAMRRVEKTRSLLERLPEAKWAEPPRNVTFFRVAIAAAAILVAGASLWLLSSHRASYAQTFSNSESGILRSILPDGSSLILNAQTELAVRFTAGERSVTLVRGEANFKVAKDAARPFVVRVDSVSVRAVGTSFDIRRSSGSVEVLVVEGKVQVRQAAAAREQNALVGAGESTTLALSGASMAVIKPEPAATIAEKTAWQEARLSFANTPLAEVVKEFNCCNSIQLVLADPELENLPLVGSFRSDNVEGFVRLLETNQKVAVQRRDGEIILRRPR